MPLVVTHNLSHKSIMQRWSGRWNQSWDCTFNTLCLISIISRQQAQNIISTQTKQNAEGNTAGIADRLADIQCKLHTILDRKSDKSTKNASKRQYIFEKKDGNPWTGTRGATRWATRTTNFLPRRITIVAGTGRGIEQTSSDKGLW